MYFCFAHLCGVKLLGTWNRRSKTTPLSQGSSSKSTFAHWMPSLRTKPCSSTLSVREVSRIYHSHMHPASQPFSAFLFSSLWALRSLQTALKSSPSPLEKNQKGILMALAYSLFDLKDRRSASEYQLPYGAHRLWRGEAASMQSSKHSFP